MKKAIVTGATGQEHNECLDISRPLFKKYAKMHEYDYLEYNLDSKGRPGAWGKINALLDSISDYDLLLWLDADLIIVDGLKDIVSEMPLEFGDFNFNMAMIMHKTGEGLIPNTGVWLLPRESKSILEDIWDREDCMNECWWEQSALMKIMGYDISVRPVVLRNETDVYKDVHWLPLHWNSHPVCPAKNAKINHWTLGPGVHNWRINGMRQDSARSNIA